MTQTGNEGWTAPKWTPAEDAIVKRSYARTPTKVISEMLGRSMSSINKRADRLGIDKAGRQTHEEIIRRMWGPHHLVSDICRKTHLRAAELVRVAESMGLAISDLKRPPVLGNSRNMPKKAAKLPWSAKTIAWAKVESAAEHVHYLNLRKPRPISEARIIAGEAARLERNAA
jgi:hypothetical protein